MKKKVLILLIAFSLIFITGLFTDSTISSKGGRYKIPFQEPKSVAVHGHLPVLRVTFRRRTMTVLNPKSKRQPIPGSNELHFPYEMARTDFQIVMQYLKHSTLGHLYPSSKVEKLGFPSLFCL
jgi:hypothetical protein